MQNLKTCLQKSTIPLLQFHACGNHKSGEDSTFGKARRCQDDNQHPIISLLVILARSLSRSATQKMRKKKKRKLKKLIRTGPKAAGISRGVKIIGDSRLRQWWSAFTPAF